MFHISININDMYTTNNIYLCPLLHPLIRKMIDNLTNWTNLRYSEFGQLNIFYFLFEEFLYYRGHLSLKLHYQKFKYIIWGRGKALPKTPNIQSYGDLELPTACGATCLFYCDYCDTFLTHDSASVRKTQWRRSTKRMCKTAYQKWIDGQARSLIDKTMAISTRKDTFYAILCPAGAMIPPPPVSQTFLAQGWS